jgi:hypothetical protein
MAPLMPSARYSLEQRFDRKINLPVHRQPSSAMGREAAISPQDIGKLPGYLDILLLFDSTRPRR